MTLTSWKRWGLMCAVNALLVLYAVGYEWFRARVRVYGWSFAIIGHLMIWAWVMVALDWIYRMKIPLDDVDHAESLKVYDERKRKREEAEARR